MSSLVTAAFLAGPAAAAAPAAPVAAAQPAPAPGSKGDAPFVNGEVLVGFRPGTAPAARASVLQSVGARAARPLSPLAPDGIVARIGDGRTVQTTIEALTRNPNVSYAEPNYVVQAAATSDDPYFTGGSLWGMYGDTTSPSNAYGSQAAEAWAAGYVGSSAVYVGVIDEGFDPNHPDLAGNAWVNPYDPVNGVDDDGNGRIDDINGWDFVSNDNSVFDGAGDDHGTHVAGTIGGVGGNGLGVAGVNWDVTMISAKFLGANGGSIADAVLAVDYITQLKTSKGLNIVATSNSWSGGGYSQALLDAINRGGDAGIVFVAAASNSNSNNDATATYPANYECTTTAAGAARGWDCVISVAAIDSAGNKASFSSYGATTVDLGAPGVNVTSSLPGATYGSYNGTSMATPHVSGAVALCASVNAGLTAATLRNAVLTTTAPTPSMAGITVTGGRLDIGSMINQCSPPTGPVSGAPSNLTATAPTAFSARLQWVDGTTGETSHEVQQAGADCTNPTTVATAGANSTSITIGQLQPATTYCFRVRAANTYNGGSVTDWTSSVTVTTPDIPPPYRCTAVPYSWVTATGTTHVLSDDSATSVGLPFTFPYYDTDFTSVSIGSNGLLAFGSTPTDYANGALPSPGAPNGLVAVLWDDLNPGAGGSVTSGTVGTAPNRQFVVTWTDVPHYSVAGSAATMQAVLDEATDSVTLQYADTVFGNAAYDWGVSASIGLESPDGQYGTQIGFNRATVGDGTAVRCARGATATPSVASTTLPNALVQNTYSATLAVAGGTAPYTWSVVSGSLPAGLSLSSTAGVITGTATTNGTSTPTLRVTDAENRTAQAAVSITVGTGVLITTASLPAATVGTAYSTTIAASGGVTPYQFVATGLPAGLSLDPSTGVLSGTPTAVGTSSVTVTVTDSTNPAFSAQRTLGLTVSAAPLSLTTTSLPQGTVGSAYSQSIVATGGTSPYSWSATALPAGLSINVATGVISGTPTTATTANVTVTVTDAGAPAQSASRTMSLVVASPLSITTASVPAGTQGVAYSTTLAATGGSGTRTWTVSTGALPSGVTLSTTGVISGTPSVNGSFAFTAQVADGFGRSATRAFTLTIAAPPTMKVSSIVLSKVTSRAGMTGRAVVTVVNGSGAVLGSVTVNGVFTLNASGATTRTGTTGSKGTVTLTSPTYANVAGQTVQFCVTSLVRSGYLFDNSGPTCASFVS